MPMVLIHTRWPHHAAEDVGKAYIEVMKKYPVDKSLYKAAVSACIKATNEGFKGLAVDDVKEGKLQEALARSWEIAAFYGTQIEGFEYSIEVWATVIEAYASIGKTPPE